MKKKAFLGSIGMMMILAGCASKATDEQLGVMCENKLKITGMLRGTNDEEESARITEEYAQKEKGLTEEMERDLKGMDDVLAGRLKEIEGGELSDEEKNEKTAAAKEDIAKKKKAITDQFEPLIEKLTPQKEYALKDAKEYVEKRKAKAADTKQTCITQAKAAGVTAPVAECRAKAATTEEYDACK